FAPMAERRAHLVAAAAAEPGSAVATLIGRGNGLTPAGDDALAGALLAACALGGHQALATAVLANTHRTTSLSATLLRAAAEGYAAPPVVAYVTAVMRGDRGAAARWRPRVEAIGHGSGRDLIAGMAGLLSTIESQPALGRVS
ncbi:oxamate carbamoyltransferase subunit AllH family protein, partial [Phycicoccus elongatus]